MKRATCIILTALAILTVAAPAQARTRALARGATVTSLHWRHESIHYIRMELGPRLIGTKPSTKNLPMHLAPTQGHGLATVPDDFNCGSRPCGFYMRGREIWQTGRGGGGMNYVQGKGEGIIGQHQWHVFIRGDGNESYQIHHVNYGHDGIVAFNPRGGSTERPTSGRCYMKLGSPGQWSVNQAGGDQRPYQVLRKRCGTPPSVDHGIVIESNTSLNYREGDTVMWTQDFGIPNAINVVSGMTQLVKNGVNIGLKKFGGHRGPDGYYYNDCPRTVLALSPNRQVAYMVVVDGLPANRAGIKFAKLGTFLVQRLHVGWAFNLDGGGSAALWTKRFGLVSKPSYGFIRSGLSATLMG